MRRVRVISDALEKKVDKLDGVWHFRLQVSLEKLCFLRAHLAVSDQQHEKEMDGEFWRHPFKLTGLVGSLENRDGGFVQAGTRSNRSTARSFAAG